MRNPFKRKPSQPEPAVRILHLDGRPVTEDDPVRIYIGKGTGTAKIDEATGEGGSKPQQEDVFPDEAPEV